MERPLSVIVSGLVKKMSGTNLVSISLGHALLDDYLLFVAARARANTLLAVAYDLKVFFTVIVKQPDEVTTADRAPAKSRYGPVTCDFVVDRLACRA